MPIYEERMVYKVGKSSLVITLPKNWLKYFRIAAGDVVEITGNRHLTIHPPKSRGRRIEEQENTHFK